MKIMSWNVSGLESCIEGDFNQVLAEVNPDIVALQDVQLSSKSNLDLDLQQYTMLTSASFRRNTVILTSKNPISTSYGLYGLFKDSVFTVEYKAFCIININYTQPNLYNPDVNRRDKFTYKLIEWCAYLDKYKNKPVIICGNFNAAHTVFDLKYPETYMYSPYFGLSEKSMIESLIIRGFVDGFRHLYPYKTVYSYWEGSDIARVKDLGLRLDYFLLSKSLVRVLDDVQYLTDVHGSTHCPVVCTLRPPRVRKVQEVSLNLDYNEMALAE